MAEFSAALNRIQADERITAERFGEIAARLASEGSLHPDRSEAERLAYDDAVRVQDELEDYFMVMGCRLAHNRALGYMHLYPPGSTAPGAPPLDGKDRESDGMLRHRSSAHVGAAAIALRVLYDQKLSTGEINAQRGVFVSIEELRVTLKNKLKRDLPPTLAERKAVIRDLENIWGVVRTSKDADIDLPETRIAIHPKIVDLVSDATASGIIVEIAREKAAPSQEEEDDGGGPNNHSESTL
jgi:hypothetical protein